MRARATTQRESRLLALAERQHGLLRYRQLREAGSTAADIGRWLAARRLVRIHDEVFALGHTARRDEAWLLAAQWTCGETAVLSHTSAAMFHGWMPLADAVHVTTTVKRISRPGVVVHRAKAVDRRDVVHSGLFVVTTIPRTFVDLADVLAWPEYRAVADAQRSLRLDRIHEAQQRAPKRRGRGLVTRLIEADDAHTKSEFERRFLRFLRAQRIPRPDEINARVAGHKADCVPRAARLVVELDGRAFHTRRAAFAADRRRDTDIQLAGYRIMRLVWDDLHPDTAAGTADRLRRMLAAGA